MMILQRRVRWLWLLALGCACIHPPAVSAQARILNNPYSSPIVQAPSPYWGYTYGYHSLFGDYFHGAADVIRSQGQFLISREKANILHEQYRQEKLKTRRKTIENWAWEREFTSQAYEKERKRIEAAELERDRTDPPQTNIWNATSLNFLLQKLKETPGLSPGSSVPVKPEWLPHIHVTFVRRGTGGNVGLLKSDQIAWPLLLRRDDFTSQREEVEKLLAQAKKEVLAGNVSADTLIKAREQVQQLEKRVTEEIRSNRNDLWSPSDFADARRSLKEFSDALQMLKRPDAAFYLTPLQGRNVAELVQSMNDKGLYFAPATTGSERHYVALHRALAQEYTNVRGGR